MREVRAYLERLRLGEVFTIIVKPDAPETKLLGFDADKNSYRIALKAPAEDNKANIELVKFLRKETGKQVKMLKGLRSRTKVVKIG